MRFLTHTFSRRLEMAEAHSAVAFSFTVTHEGVNVDFNSDAVTAIWQSGVRSWKKRIGKWKVSDVEYENVEHFD